MTDHITPRIIFGVHELCPKCKGTKVNIPMTKAEKKARARHMQHINPGPWERWPCNMCNGVGVVNVSDLSAIIVGNTNE